LERENAYLKEEPRKAMADAALRTDAQAARIPLPSRRVAEKTRTAII
jgi:hypothetical protein